MKRRRRKRRKKVRRVMKKMTLPVRNLKAARRKVSRKTSRT